MSLVTSDMMPMIQILQPGQEMRRYPYKKTEINSITVSSIKTFLDDFTANKFKPDLRSEIEPEQTSDSYTIVGSSWDRVVKDTTKDVFVFFYAPWCQSCANLAETWDKLAVDVKSQENLVIAKINMDANELEETVVKFPVIRLYTKENKAGIEFEITEKNQGLDRFKAFLIKHSSEYRMFFDNLDVVKKVKLENYKSEDL